MLQINSKSKIDIEFHDETCECRYGFERLCEFGSIFNLVSALRILGTSK